MKRRRANLTTWLRLSLATLFRLSRNSSADVRRKHISPRAFGDYHATGRVHGNAGQVELSLLVEKFLRPASGILLIALIVAFGIWVARRKKKQ